ncbi:hypothetical protein ACFFTT_13130, partial [Actinoplanes octamycinicus]
MAIVNHVAERRFGTSGRVVTVNHVAEPGLGRFEVPGSGEPPAPQRREEADMPARVPQDLDRNIALDLVRVTEAAAMA